MRGLISHESLKPFVLYDPPKPSYVAGSAQQSEHNPAPNRCIVPSPQVGVEFAKHLALGLKGLPLLQNLTLTLPDNDLGDDGVEALAELKDAPQMQVKPFFLLLLSPS